MAINIDLFGTRERGLRERYRIAREEEQKALQPQLSRQRANAAQLAQSLAGTPGPYAGDMFPAPGLSPQADIGARTRTLQDMIQGGLGAQAVAASTPAPAQRFDVSDSMLDNFTPESLNRFANTGDYRSLVPRPQTGPAVPLTGQITTAALNTVNRFDQLQRIKKIYDDHGVTGFQAWLANDPRAAAELAMFKDISLIGMMKEASGDTGTISESDMERYSRFSDASLYDVMFQGGAEAKALVDMLIQDMGRPYRYYKSQYADTLGEEFFRLTDYGDIGEPVEPGGFMDWVKDFGWQP